MQNKIIPLLIYFSLCPFILTQAQDEHIGTLMKKYNHYRERLENEYVLVSPDVEMYGTNIPAVDRLRNQKGYKHLSWSDGNSNFHDYIILLVTEIELLKRNDQPYKKSLTALVYAMLAIERLDLYSEYNLRLYHDKKMLHKGDSINQYIKYPADINGFMIRDDVSFGFWMSNHRHFGFDLGKPDEKLTRTTKYQSIFQEGTIPLQGMSQDVIIHLLEALTVMDHFMDKEFAGDIPVNFQNDLIPEYLNTKGIWFKDVIDFKAWARDLSLRLINNIQQNEKQAAVVYKPWYKMGKITNIEFLKLLSTRWYIMNPVTEKPVREGSGTDMGVLINAHGFARTVENITGARDLHFEHSDRGFLRWLFRTVYYKELKLPLGAAIALPRNWDDNKTRSLASFGNVHGSHSPVFFSLREIGMKHRYRYYILTNYLLNQDKLNSLYHPGTAMWKEDSTWFADVLKLAPPDGPFSDTTRDHYTVYWSTSSRLVWPQDAPTWRGGTQFEYAGMDYMALHNLYRLVYCDEHYFLDYKPVRKELELAKKTAQLDDQINEKVFLHAPVIQDHDSIRPVFD